MTVSITSEYARSHSGKNYTARCTGCPYVDSAGGFPLAEVWLRERARNHVCPPTPVASS